MNEKAPFLSLILPIHNEAGRLEENLMHVLSFMRSTPWSFEIVGVNDGSSDGSEAILRRVAASNPEVLPVSSPVNAGKGKALKQGISVSKGEWVVTMDADLELPIEQICTFLMVQEETGGTIVIGSKWHPDTKLDYPQGRRVLSRGLHQIVGLLFPLHVTDTQVGFKLLQGEAARFVSRITLVKRFAWDIELLLVSQMYGLKIVESPVVLKFSRVEIGRIRIRTILQLAREVIGIWFRYYVTDFYSRSLTNHARQLGLPAHIMMSSTQDTS